MNWSRQQVIALDLVADWLRDRYQQVFYLAGFAGTGKTTLAQHFALHTSGRVIFAAFTGKAASVLRAKGCPEANTLHHYLYNVSDADRTKLRELEAQMKETQDAFDSAPDPDTALYAARRLRTLEREILEERERIKGPRFRLNLESPIQEAALVILDEASMINSQLGQDLLSFNVPILVLGDPAQLPPVKGTGYFTSRTPDFLLTEIHRQAADNPIIQYATAIREGRRLPFSDDGLARKIRRDDVTPDMLAEADQVLCGTNKMRRKVNRRLRARVGLTSLYPKRDDKLVVLRNEKDFDVLNGVTCRAASDTEEDEWGESLLLTLDYDGRMIPDVPLDPGPFAIYNDPTLPDNWATNRHLLQIDYGYALTVHKAQGSQWPYVFIIDDGFAKRNPRQRQQWLYTAVTRAETKMTLAV